ncbi:DUF1735 domain-containing protein [Pedobacter immunditicola]|uniref:DUF1735 domain-containing protein n=1 Tax=Pedobacter immunditicola TaxID=3133440 RepID=UPI0030A612BF
MKKNIIKSLLLFFAVTAFSSCLKDDSLVLNPEKGHNVIEFGNTSEIAVHGSTIPLYIHSYEIVPEVSLPVVISYSGPESAAPADITVNVVVGAPSTLEAYNKEQGTKYGLMPTKDYELTANQVVIPKGQTKATLMVKFKLAGFNLAETNALPLTITSVSSGIISQNFGTAIFAIGGKNKFDGIFTYKTSANTSLVPNANKTVTLITQTANSVKLSPGLLGTYSNEVIYTVDPTTNRVTVTCPSLGVQEPQDARSKWDPATKTMTVFWKQGNGGRTFEETFVYKGSR